ncbi:MAG: SDR family oxidoreductase [Chloroflexi bacterium]|nr:SDR family oxidoreductase [Chloroflexota bacterium]
MRLQGKVALITGGGSGIGEAMALRFAAEGAATAIVDLNQKGAERVVSAIQKTGGRAHAIAADVASENDVRAMLAETQDRFGPLDILVNNAGIYVDKDIEGTTEDEWDRIMNVNVKSLLWTCKYALPSLKETKGVILNIASMVGVHAQPHSIAYCASKGAVITFTRALALDCAQYGVRANSLCPSSVATPLFESFLNVQPDPDEARAGVAARAPLGYISSPEQMADAALFLVSDESSYFTGTELYADGGGTLGYKTG